MGGLCPMAGGTAGQWRTDNDWFVRAGRRDRANDPRFGSGYGSRNKMFTLWPMSARMIGDTSVDFGMFGRDAAGGADFYQAWSPWQRSMRGSGRVAQFTPGYTYNASGGVIGGATVQIFRTSDDAYVGAVQSNDQGWFQAWSPYPSVGHYFVAYAPGAPDVAGTTVNTLTPT